MITYRTGNALICRDRNSEILQTSSTAAMTRSGE
jgi:hypothetical protein